MTDATGAPRHVSHSFELGEGRRVRVQQVGPLGGEPVLLCHGLPGSRVLPEQAERAAVLAGVRLIALDRPGFGRSDFLSGRTLRQWPHEAAEVLKAERLESFRVLGISAGAPYALACCHELPDRVKAAAVVSGVTPLDRTTLADGFAKAIPRAARPLLRLRGSPRVLHAVLARLMRRAPERAAEQIGRLLSDTDRELLTGPDGRGVLASMVEGVRQGGRAWNLESELLSQSWGFDLERIPTPVVVWHGEEDLAVPPDHARYVAEALPNGRLTLCPGLGHLGVAIRQLDGIFEDLLAA
jgi:pimeloyl-ACP methyl ester carboxylesterase